MTWNLDDNRPIYSQLMAHLQFEIISGLYAAGEKLPSVRDLAQAAAVNPNTMQKALSELEADGLVVSQRTAGRTVTEDVEKINSLRASLSQEIMQSYLNDMGNLGNSPRESFNLLQKYMEDMN